MAETIITVPAGESLARNQFNQPVCTTDRPWREGDEVPVVHPLAREAGPQVGGWPGGDLVTMECPTCGTRWIKELPQ